jgi:hypothetical protein
MNLWASSLIQALFFIFFMLVMSGASVFILRRHLVKNSDISDGFAFFLVTQFLVAFPFLFKNLSFSLYLNFFLLSSFLIVAYGFYTAVTQKDRVSIFPDYLCFGIVGKKQAFVLYGLIFAVLVLTTIFQRYSLDDATYLAMITQDIGDRHLRLIEPSMGNHEVGIQPYYKFQFWELLLAAYSHISGVHVAVLTHTVIPLFIIPVALIAFSKTLAKILPKEYVLMAVAILALVFAFSGYTKFTPGSFLLGRSWQGKAILLHLVMPIILFQLIDFFANSRDKGRLFYIALLAVTGAGLNLSAIYLISALVTSFCLLALIKKVPFKDIVLLGFSLLPLVLLAGLIYWEVKNYVSHIDLQPFSYALFFSALASFSLHILVLVAAYFYVKKKQSATQPGTNLSDNAKLLFVSFPLVLAGIYLNPLLSPLVANYLTSPWTYWRMFWLLPAELYLAYRFTYLFFELKQEGFKPPKFLGSALSKCLVIALAALLVQGFMFIPSHGYHLASSPYKLPADVLQIVELIEENSEGVSDYENERGMLLESNKNNVVLADQLSAIYLRSSLKNVELAFTRKHLLRITYDVKQDEYKERVFLQNVIDGEQVLNNEGGANKRFFELLQKYEVSWLIFDKTNTKLRTQLLDNEGLELGNFNRTSVVAFPQNRAK